MLKTKYITGDDFKEFFGIDLSIRLKDNDNPSDKVNSFLIQREDEIATYINETYYRDVDTEYGYFTEYQKKEYKKALLYQAYYILKNGDIGNDSGYDLENGVVASQSTLKELMISKKSIQHLRLCGLACRKIKNKGRTFGDDWWLY